jgi:hypothetical protein
MNPYRCEGCGVFVRKGRTLCDECYYMEVDEQAPYGW